MRLLKKITVRLVLAVLSNAFISASKFEMEVRKELSSWPEGFSLAMRVMPAGPFFVLKKMNGRMYKASIEPDRADLVISFKNLEAAFLLFTVQISTAEGYCEKRLNVSGDIPKAMSAIRILSLLETFLFPAFLARRAVKRLPSVSFFRKSAVRLRLYTTGILFGI